MTDLVAELARELLDVHARRDLGEEVRADDLVAGAAREPFLRPVVDEHLAARIDHHEAEWQIVEEVGEEVESRRQAHFRSLRWSPP